MGDLKLYWDIQSLGMRDISMNFIFWDMGYCLHQYPPHPLAQRSGVASQKMHDGNCWGIYLFKLISFSSVLPSNGI